MLVVEGTHGAEWFLQTAKRIEARCNTVARVSVQGGHHLHLESPEATAQVIRDFTRSYQERDEQVRSIDEV